MTDDEADMYYDRWLVAKNKVKKLEERIEQLEMDKINLELRLNDLQGQIDDLNNGVNK